MPPPCAGAWWTAPIHRPRGRDRRSAATGSGARVGARRSSLPRPPSRTPPSPRPPSLRLCPRSMRRRRVPGTQSDGRPTAAAARGGPAPGCPRWRPWLARSCAPSLRSAGAPSRRPPAASGSTASGSAPDARPWDAPGALPFPRWVRGTPSERGAGGAFRGRPRGTPPTPILSVIPGKRLQKHGSGRVLGQRPRRHPAGRRVLSGSVLWRPRTRPQGASGGSSGAAGAAGSKSRPGKGCQRALRS